jgi:hypothetical protein
MPAARPSRFLQLAAASFGAVGVLSLAGVFSAFRAHVRAIAPDPTSSAAGAVLAPSSKPAAVTPAPQPAPEPAAPPPDPCRQAFDAGKMDEAQKTCAKALDSIDEPAARAAIYTTIGLVEEKKGQKKAAEHDFFNALGLAYSDETAEALARVGSLTAKARPGKATISVHGAKNATVHKDPKKSSPKVASVKAGAEVTTIATVEAKSEAWTSVEIDGKKRGWISDAVLSGGADQ